MRRKKLESECVKIREFEIERDAGYYQADCQDESGCAVLFRRFSLFSVDFSDRRTAFYAKPIRSTASRFINLGLRFYHT